MNLLVGIIKKTIGTNMSASGKKLSRELVCKECTFGKSALVQNKLLKTKFEDIVVDLRQRGILVTEFFQQPDNIQYPDQEIFIKSYEEKVAQFKVNADLLKKLLDQYSKELDKLY